MCPICNSAMHRLFQKHGYWIRECEVCHHRFAEITPPPDHVGRIYGDHYFQEGGDGYPDYLSEAETLTAYGRRYASSLKRYMTPDTVLDVGSAAGFILKGFQEMGWGGCGIEPNARMAEYARTQQGLHVVNSTLEQFRWSEHRDNISSCCPEGCNLISMIQVVAHFYDLRKALQVAAEFTWPGGFWLIETWDRESFIARVLGKHWHEYSPPSVLHWFSPEGLERLAEEFGFSGVARGRPLKWLTGAHGKSLLRHKLPSSPLGRLIARLLGVIPDNLAIPYPPCDLFWILFQKS